MDHGLIKASPVGAADRPDRNGDGVPVQAALIARPVLPSFSRSSRSASSLLVPRSTMAMATLGLLLEASKASWPEGA